MRYYSSTAQTMHLTAPASAGDTSITVDSVTGLPGSTPFTVVIDVDTPSEEIVTVTSVGGTTLTVLRGQDGLSATSHTSGAAVRHMITARDLREPQQHIEASTGVHGLAGGVAVVGTTTAQTLNNKTLDFAGGGNTATGIPGTAFAASALQLMSPTGAITAYAGTTAPAGWLLCDGAAVSRTTYATLFGVIGTTFGVGDNVTTFNVPNLKGRVIVGRDAGQTEFDVLGETGGAKAHTLTQSEMPSHTHVQDAHNHTQQSHNHTQQPHAHNYNGPTFKTVVVQSGSGNSQMWGGADALNTTASTTAVNDATTAVNNATTATNQNTGGGAAHNNLQPYMALSYCIKI